MAVNVNERAFVVGSATPVALSQTVTVTASASHPAHLVLAGLDRNEYAASVSGATAYLAGRGQTEGFSTIGGDARGVSIVFTYQAAAGRYCSSTYGYLDQLSYPASGRSGDVTNLSPFGMSNLSLDRYYAAKPWFDAGGCRELPGKRDGAGLCRTGAAPGDARLDRRHRGQFCGPTMERERLLGAGQHHPGRGRRVVAVQSTSVGLPGQGSGEWFVAYNGPAGATGNWQALVTTGDVVAFQTAAGGGHITTCVSGSGGTAMLVDKSPTWTRRVRR